MSTFVCFTHYHYIQLFCAWLIALLSSRIGHDVIIRFTGMGWHALTAGSVFVSLLCCQSGEVMFNTEQTPCGLKCFVLITHSGREKMPNFVFSSLFLIPVIELEGGLTHPSGRLHIWQTGGLNMATAELSWPCWAYPKLFPSHSSFW